MMHHKALVVGGLGVIGRRLVEELATLADWDIVALSRRRPDFDSRARFIAVDLLDRAAAEQALAGISDITHIFYCGLDGGISAGNVARNLALLVNPVEIVEAASPALRRIVLMQGGKVYGRHLGPFKTPAKETDPRHMPPNFYYDQEDFLRQRQAGRDWSWTALRPETVTGFALGNPMNLLMLIGTYAAIAKELGLPLSFPGRPGAYRTLFQVTDAGLLARCTVWAANDPGAANQAFNVTNGDCFRWQHLWPLLADFFGMAVGQPPKLELSTVMADKGDLWDRIVRRHGLRPHRYEDMAMWPFGDFTFDTDWDLLLDDGKRIRAGFCEVIDSEARMLALLGELRANRIIP